MNAIEASIICNLLNVLVVTIKHSFLDILFASLSMSKQLLLGITLIEIFALFVNVELGIRLEVLVCYGITSLIYNKSSKREMYILGKTVQLFLQVKPHSTTKVIMF